MRTRSSGGGTGYFYPDGGPHLPEEIEHIYPDYNLYPDLTEKTAFGFLTRGCPRNCGFCIVSKKEGRASHKVADLSEFWSGQKEIKLLDPNVNQTSGSAVVTVKVSAGTNHTAPADKTCQITAAFVSSVLNENDWATIRQVSDNGQGPNYWSVGDRKAEKLTGTVGSLSLNGTYYPFIVDFDHNKAKESPNAHTITFQFAKSALSGGKDIAFCDSQYNSTGSSAAFRMNTTNTNSGGWTGSYAKKTICPQFKAALTAALRNVIKTVTVYTDNVGGGSNAAGNVTASTEDVYYPAEFEIHGSRSWANSAEQNYQTQLAYYKAGNSKVKYKHDATGTAAIVWCRSASCGSSALFCFVNTSGGADRASACYSLGVAPLLNV